MRYLRRGYISFLMLGILCHAGIAVVVILRMTDSGDRGSPAEQIVTILLVAVWIVACAKAPSTLDSDELPGAGSLLPCGILFAVDLALLYLQRHVRDWSLLVLPTTLLVASFACSARHTLIAGGAFTLAAAGILLRLGHPIHAQGVLAVLTVAMLGTAVLRYFLRDWSIQSEMFNQARRAASELPNVLMRLDDVVAKTERDATRRECTRIAREVHDTVGYSLTALLVQLNVVREMIGEETVRSRLRQLDQLVRLTLSDTRNVVTSLRREHVLPEAPGWLPKWQRLCDVFGKCTGVAVDVHIGDGLADVDTEIGEAFYRIIQEALTNSYQHGKSSYAKVDMNLRTDMGLILLKISDDGIGCLNPMPGNGLSGIRERSEALHGTAVWNTRPHMGFDLGVDIPWKGR